MAGAAFSPLEMFEVGLAKSGGLLLPNDPTLAFAFLDVAWRTIQHYGVEVDGRRYDGPALNLHRNHRSPYAGVHKGKWPIFVDQHDVRRVWFQDPDSGEFTPLVWEHAAALDQPFGRDAAEYTKHLALRTHRHVDPMQAMHDLLQAWSRGEVTSRREKSVALRLSAARALPTTAGATEEPNLASVPGVADLLAARAQQATGPALPDDLDELFDKYYAEHPEEEFLEVFDE